MSSYCCVSPKQSDKRFMHKGRRLQRVARLFGVELELRHPAELAVRLFDKL
jgi:hypothetical protein